MGSHELDFPGFAQEFLRRNPAYRKQFTAVSQSGDSRSTAIAQEDMARNWGLSFPLPA
jgi:hypothetical protein